jgi:hypothetical protein
MANPTTSVVIERRPARAGRIILGAVLLLVAAVSSTNVKTASGDVAGALGALTLLLVLVLPAVWLIASGLPLTIAANTGLRKARRWIWLRLVGLGFLVMLALAAAFAALSWSGAAVIVTWLYWFGWTWISWLLADRKALRQLQTAAQDEPPPS